MKYHYLKAISKDYTEVIIGYLAILSGIVLLLTLAFPDFVLTMLIGGL